MNVNEYGNGPILKDDEVRSILAAIPKSLRRQHAMDVICWATSARIGEMILELIIQGKVEITRIEGGEPKIRMKQS